MILVKLDIVNDDISKCIVGGYWYEVMYNKRNKPGAVACMKWNEDGSKICIVYQDG